MPWKSPNGKLLYRIGDVLISTNSQNPSEWFGGVWQLLCPGKTMVCIDTNDSDFNQIKKTGGSKFLQSHNHSASSGYVSNDHSHYLSLSTNTTGNHSHTLGYNSDVVAKGSSYDKPMPSTSTTGQGYRTSVAGDHSHTVSGNTGGVSSNHTHSISVASSGNGNAQNLQPYVVVYMWIRVA